MKLFYYADTKKDETPDLFYADTPKGLEQLGVDICFVVDMEKIARIYFGGSKDDAMEEIEDLTAKGLIDRVNELISCSEVAIKFMNVKIE